MMFTLQDIGGILSGLYRDLRKSIEQRGRKMDETTRVEIQSFFSNWPGILVTI